MNIRIRTVVLSFAFATTAAVAITGATLRGETRETHVATACAMAEWPRIPASCLEGARGETVRYVAVEAVVGG